MHLWKSPSVAGTQESYFVKLRIRKPESAVSMAAILNGQAKSKPVRKPIGARGPLTKVETRPVRPVSEPASGPASFHGFFGPCDPIARREPQPEGTPLQHKPLEDPTDMEVTSEDPTAAELTSEDLTDVDLTPPRRYFGLERSQSPVAISAILTGYKETQIDPFFLTQDPLDTLPPTGSFATVCLSSEAATIPAGLSECLFEPAGAEPIAVPTVRITDILRGAPAPKALPVPSAARSLSVSLKIPGGTVQGSIEVSDGDFSDNLTEIEALVHQSLAAKTANAMDIFNTLKTKDEQKRVDRKEQKDEARRKQRHQRALDQQSRRAVITDTQGPPGLTPSARSVRPKNCRRHMVTLRLPLDVLGTIKPTPQIIDLEGEEDPFFTKGNAPRFQERSATPTRPLGSLLRIMSDRSAGEPKMNAFQRAKHTPLPVLRRPHFHVVPAVEPSEPRSVGLAPRGRLEVVQRVLSDPSSMGMAPARTVPLERAPLRWVFEATAVTRAALVVLLVERVPAALTDPVYAPLLALLQAGQMPVLLWLDVFRPQSSSALLGNGKPTRRLRKWLVGAFERLKRHRGPRFAAKRSTYTDMDDFLDDGEGSEAEVFVPLMILTGPQGSGKSAAVAACMKECGGYVHEINSGQARGRKDIMAQLNELSTTQLVHKSDDGFQKGLLLFEDVDVLFEQDGGFWAVLHNVLNVGRRPVVITCEDPSSIPRNLLHLAKEAGGFLRFDTSARVPLIDYLVACCLVMGYDVDRSIVDSLVDGSRDVRKGLTELQLLCQTARVVGAAEPVLGEDEVLLTSVSRARVPLAGPEPASLAEWALSADQRSLSDVMRAGECSTFHHTASPNEIVDRYVVPSSLQCTLRPLPYEVSVARHLQDHWAYPGRLPVARSFNSIRTPCREFFSSKFKRMPLFQERKTRMAFSHIPESIKVHHSDAIRVLANNEMVLTLAPVLRHIARREIERRAFFSRALLELPRSGQTLLPGETGEADTCGWDGRRFETNDFSRVLGTFGTHSVYEYIL